MHFTEDQINRLKHFAEKYDLGHVEVNEGEPNILELPICGMSIEFETEVLTSKSLLGTTLHDGYIVSERVSSYGSWGDDIDISEVGVYPTFDQAVIALLTRVYENKVYTEVMEHDIHKAYEDGF